MDLADVPRHRPLAFDKMEALIKEMQDPETGVPVRSQKIFLSLIPSAFMGYDLVEWLMDRFNLDEASNVEAINLGNQLCQHGYFFPVNDLKNLVLKDDSSLYRFQSPYYWPWTGARGGAAPGPDNVEYAIYLVKRTLRNKQRHALDDYEQEALANLRRNLAAKWDFITMQAEEQVRLAKERKKGDKIVSDSQERAYWRVARPPPGVVSALEPCPVPVRARHHKPRKRTLQQLQLEIDVLQASLERTPAKPSVALEALVTYSETFAPYDPWVTVPQPNNPWVSDDTLFWQINSPLVEVPSASRVQRWAVSIEELVADPTGLQEFTSFLRKEYSHENIRFWLAVMDLRRSSAKAIPGKLQQIYEEFLKPGAPCEINIDGATAEKVSEGIKTGSRYALDHAADHVYNLLLKKDCYPRFIRSDHFQRLLADGRNVHQKKKFFNFGGGQVKKKPATAAGAGTVGGAGLSRRRGSDRSLSGSAHELAVCAAQPTRPQPPPPPHSHSQSNLADLRDPVEESGDEVAPWESCGREPAGVTRRQDSAAESSSSAAAATNEASERRRLPQQTTLDGGLRGAPPPLRRLSAVEPRHLPPLTAEPPRPRPRPHTPAHTPPHPTPTISVSSAPDDEQSLEERDDPPSVFTSTAPTPTNETDKTLNDSKSEMSEVSEPIAGCSRDAPRTITREPTVQETSPASSKCSRYIGDLPGSPPDKGNVVVDRVDWRPAGLSDENTACVESAAHTAPPAASASGAESAVVGTTQVVADEPAAADTATSTIILANVDLDVVTVKPDEPPLILQVPPSKPDVITPTPSMTCVPPDMASSAAKVETVTSIPSVVPSTSNMAPCITKTDVEPASVAAKTPHVVLTTSNVALKTPNVAAATPNVAAATSNVAAATPNVAATTLDVAPTSMGATAAVTPDTAAAPTKPVAPLAETEDLCADDDRAPSPSDTADGNNTYSQPAQPATNTHTHEGEHPRNDVCPWEDE